MTDTGKSDGKEVRYLIPDHESTALVRSRLRERFLHELAGLLSRNSNHEKALAVTDPKRWDTRFAEIVSGLSPAARERICIALGIFAEYWQVMSVADREIVAVELGKRIVAERVVDSLKKHDSLLFTPLANTSRMVH